MKILLAGYNLDADLISEVPDLTRRIDATPETLSAAYARISRNPKPVDELRLLARQEVTKARQSNETIIFTMGHHSVAEHAVFNVDIIDVSRLAIEEIEHFRLCSFTEKSQRYIKLKSGYVIPHEISGSMYESEYIITVQKLQNTYVDFYNALKVDYLQSNRDRFPPEELKNQAKLRANEDARYILPLATMGQLGLTANARNLELIIRRFAAQPLSEMQSIGAALYDKIKSVAPSLLLFTAPSRFDADVYHDLKEYSAQLACPGEKKLPLGLETVVLLGATPNADLTLIASLLHRIRDCSYRDCLADAQNLGQDQCRELIKRAFQHAELYDVVVREFEFINCHWELIVSASNFAQLKRHRLASQSVQEYNPALGLTVPATISHLGLEDKFRAAAQDAEKLYYKLAQAIPTSAPYILTNAHRRRVHFSCNAREFYHISRLREDHHAQWDIRQLIGQMHQSLKPIMPLVTVFLGGKDRYPQIYQDQFGVLPRVILPDSAVGPTQH